MGTVGLADVRQAGASGPMMMFQLYVFKERDFVKQLIQRTQHACALCICATAAPCHHDCPYLECLRDYHILLWWGSCIGSSAILKHWMAADAERSGYNAIVVTVDAPFLGKREADERDG